MAEFEEDKHIAEENARQATAAIEKEFAKREGTWQTFVESEAAAVARETAETLGEIPPRVPREELEAKVKQILKDAGIRMSIGGCGCCGSPWISFEYQGDKFIDYEDNFNLDMFTEETSSEA